MKPTPDQLLDPDKPLPKTKKVTSLEVTVPGQGVQKVGARRLMAIPDIETKVMARMDEFLDAMFDLALGVHVQHAKFDRESGEVVTRVYERPPDYKALAFLIENVIGKVPQRVEMTGKDGGPVQVVPYMTMDAAMRLGLFTPKPQTEEEVIEGEYSEAADAPSD